MLSTSALQQIVALFSAEKWNARYTRSRAQATTVFPAVLTLRREFSDFEESTMYGAPAIRIGKRLVACTATHRSAEQDSLVVRTDFEQRAALLSENPETFCLADHYARHPLALVRVNRLRQDQLCELLIAARPCVITHAQTRSSLGGQLSVSRSGWKPGAPEFMDREDPGEPIGTPARVFRWRDRGRDATRRFRRSPCCDSRPGAWEQTSILRSVLHGSLQKPKPRLRY